MVGQLKVHAGLISGVVAVLILTGQTRARTRAPKELTRRRRSRESTTTPASRPQRRADTGDSFRKRQSAVSLTSD